MSTDKVEGSEDLDLKAFDAPEDEDFNTKDDSAATEETAKEEKPKSKPKNKSEPKKVQVKLNGFIGNNYEDSELGKLQRGEVVSVSEAKAEELLAVRAGNGKLRFSRL